jgi:hypothetical protein
MKRLLPPGCRLTPFLSQQPVSITSEEAECSAKLFFLLLLILLSLNSCAFIAVEVIFRRSARDALSEKHKVLGRES